MQKPQHYIQTVYEKRSGFKFDQPVDRLNGKTYYQYPPGSFERQNWGSIYWDSYKYNTALVASKFDSDLWQNETVKQKAFIKIYDFIANGKSGSASSITALLPFEIFLLNDGFEMLSFCEMNAINPGVSIIASKQIGDHIINPKFLHQSRCYLKNNNHIYLAFGIKIAGKKTNFYFKTTNSHSYFQVDNNPAHYLNAINGRLTKLEQDIITPIA